MGTTSPDTQCVANACDHEVEICESQPRSEIAWQHGGHDGGDYSQGRAQAVASHRGCRRVVVGRRLRRRASPSSCRSCAIATRVDHVLLRLTRRPDGRGRGVRLAGRRTGDRRSGRSGCAASSRRARDRGDPRRCLRRRGHPARRAGGPLRDDRAHTRYPRLYDVVAARRATLASTHLVVLDRSGRLARAAHIENLIAIEDGAVLGALGNGSSPVDATRDALGEVVDVLAPRLEDSQ